MDFHILNSRAKTCHSQHENQHRVGTAETVWMVELLEELGFDSKCDVLCDNKPTIQ